MKSRLLSKPSLLILLLALLIRLPISYSSYIEAQEATSIYESRLVNSSDSSDYLRLAENIVEHGEYSIASHAPELKRVPGYPIFLAGLFILAGQQHSPALILLSNLILALLNIWLVIRIADNLFSAKIAVLAGLVYALAPISMALADQAMSETLFTFLLLLSFYFLLSQKLETWKQIIIAATVLAILMALATYVRAIATYVLPIFLLYWVLRFFEWWKSLALLALTLGLFIALLFPWYYRNQQVFGVYTFSSVSDGNLLTYNAASVYASEQGIGLRPAKNFMNSSLGAWLSEHPEIDGANPAVLASSSRQIAMEVLLRNPLLSILVHIKDSVNTFRPGFSEMNLAFFDSDVSYGNNVGTGELPQLNELSLSQMLVFGFTAAYYTLVYLGAALGLLLLLWQKAWLKLLLLFVLPYWFAVIPSIAGNSRFRVPIEGFLAILVSLALMSLWEFLWQRRAEKAA